MLLLTTFYACNKGKTGHAETRINTSIDFKEIPIKRIKSINPDSLTIIKEFLYDKHTLKDIYPYRKGTREFQWDKIRERLAFTDSLRQIPANWGILKNYKNLNGTAALAINYQINEYKRASDMFGTERYQGIPLYTIPLYKPEKKNIPYRYALDGSLVRIMQPVSDSLKYIKVETTSFNGEWWVPKVYLKIFTKPIDFKKVIIVDKTNQNIATFEKSDSADIWLVRSMNPVSTGLHKPPYQIETPNGLFVIQDKMRKMLFLKDGTKDIAGYSPYASRFSGGGYLHGVPLNYPEVTEKEFSSSLGTTPRSHMCIRNATSHAKFIYTWGEVNNTLVFVYE